VRFYSSLFYSLFLNAILEELLKLVYIWRSYHKRLDVCLWLITYTNTNSIGRWLKNHSEAAKSAQSHNARMEYKHIACSTEHQQMKTREPEEMMTILHTEQHKTESQNGTQVEHCLSNSKIHYTSFPIASLQQVCNKLARAEAHCVLTFPTFHYNNL